MKLFFRCIFKDLFFVIYILILFSFNNIYSTDSTYTYLVHGFYLKVDSSWQEIPTDSLYKAQELFLSKSKTNFGMNLVSGFKLVNSSKTFSLPLILIYVNNGGKLIESELDKIETINELYNDTSSDLYKNNPSLAPIIRNLDVGKFILDEERKIIWSSMSDNKTFMQIRGAHLTNKGYIAIECYSTYNDFNFYEKNLSQIIESLEIENFLKYDRDPRSVERNNWTWPLKFILILIVLVYIFTRKKRSQNN